MTEENTTIEEQGVVTTKQRLRKRALVLVYASWAVLAGVLSFLLVKGIIDIF